LAVTIHDVAREAGVSIKTVSRAMNDHPDVSAATRVSVIDVARELGYRPNAVAQGLRRGSTGMVALLVADILNPHFAELARHVQTLARAGGRHCVLSSYDGDQKIAIENIRAFSDHRVDGLIWMTDVMSEAAIETVVASLLPTVTTAPEIPSDIANIRHVQGGTDPDAYERAGYLAASHLIRLGHRRIAYVAESPELSVVQARLAGFHRGIGEAGLPADSGLVWTERQHGLHTSEFGYQATLELLTGTHRPTAFCASSDMVATGVLRALHQRFLSVPHDISVVGCDGTWQSAYTHPPLTTLQTPYEAWCRTALSLLDHLIESEDGPEPICDAGFELIVRESTGPALTDNSAIQ
jgi:DNA-binding LacI/PurR family transcriptional regulator